MTEKKKRGRPRKIVLTKTMGALEVPELPHETKSQEDMKKFWDDSQHTSEKLIPPAGLSKVATLQWLTEQNAKK